MCGRLNLHATDTELAEAFGLDALPDLHPRFNISPTQDLLAVRRGRGDHPQASYLRWGLVPSWKKDPGPSFRTINARAETLETKPAFKEAFRHRRCLIPTTGFYEWKKTGGAKQPFVIRRRDQRVFAFAGLWERWEREGEALETCSIVTTEANPLVRPIHDRMPVIVPPDRYEEWLNPTLASPEALRGLLVPAGEEELEAVPISNLVSHPDNDGPELLKPVPAPVADAAAEPRQRVLF